MGPPRRTRSTSNAQFQSLPPHPREQRPPPAQRPTSSNFGMSPASRYNHNLKVLRRRDPSIVSIFDQFSHVCVYHHNGNKWEKQGFEGSMFLYERDSYPPYGFYILNRMGMDDYIQRLYPEDDVGAHGSYLMLRSYPDFTARRLAIASTIPYTSPPNAEDQSDKFALKYVIPDIENIKSKDLGRSQTRGLWMFPTDAREPMIDVVLRLHSYIKKNKAYPEQFRYGPDRPPPPNSRLSPAGNSAVANSQPPMRTIENGFQSDPDEERDMNVSSGVNSYGTLPFTSQSSVNGHTTSELDKLFAKIDTSTTSNSSSGESTSKMSVESLFAALSGTSASPAPPTSGVGVPAPSGLSLLDSIFASAASPAPSHNPSGFPDPPSAPPSTYLAHAQAQLTPASRIQSFNHLTSSYGPPQPVILSPTPASSSLPQILNQDVISTLLGLAPSPSPSHSSAASSRSRRSRQYQGDNEGSDEGVISDAYSESSTVLDADADQTAESSSGMPLLAASLDNGYENGPESGRISGDVTPRPPLRGELKDLTKYASTLVPPTTLPAVVQRHINPTSASHLQPSSVPAIPVTPSTSSSTVKGSAVQTKRTLVPFEADSELWPYPRAPVDDRSLDTADADIVELDFSDTSALSDPEKFEAKIGQGKPKSAEKKKKGRRERAADRERERQEIEKSWDVPALLKTAPQPSAPAPAVDSTKTSPKVNGSVVHHAAPAEVNGTKTKGKAKAAPGLDHNVLRETLVDSVSARLSAQHLSTKPFGRNEFVRDMLTLIHTDKAFVDKLFMDYMARSG